MVAGARLICSAAELVDGGHGVRFEYVDAVRGETLPAFVVRHRGGVHAYTNRCAHVAIELDWQPGVFFDVEGEYLQCATHGALYAPASGHCVAGPCRGGRLQALAVCERDGAIWLLEASAGE